MEDNISNIIKKSIDNFENKNISYNNFIIDQNVTFDRVKNMITYLDTNKKFNYNVLGMFDKSTNVWFWGWMMPMLYINETDITKQILDYGLKINPSPVNSLSNEMLYIKTQLINSRFLLDNFFQLEIHLALSCFLIKDQIKFIYPRKRILDESKSIIIFYVVY